MNAESIIPPIISPIVSLLGGSGLTATYIAWRRSRDDRRTSKSADWAAFMSEQRQAIADEREKHARESEAYTERLNRLEDALEASHRRRQTEVSARDQHIDALQAQIWQQLPPPPVAPPTPY